MSAPIIVITIVLDDAGNVTENTQVTGVPTLEGIAALTEKLQAVVDIVRNLKGDE